jgi:hypothetical protein
VVTQINKTVCKKEFQVKLRTFHQLKTNDFDDGLMIIGVYSSFLIPREEEPQIIVPMADVMVGYPERAYRGRKPCGETFGENHLKYSKG